MPSSPPPVHRVLHLAMDYPCRNRPINTPAVRRFVRSNPYLDYRVFALTRSANPFHANALPGDERGDPKVVSLGYWGLPFGILLFFSMTLVAWRIYRRLKAEKLHFDAVHAHKFAFEGIAGWWLARWLKLPLILSVRGNSDHKVVKFKPHYRWFFRRQLADCRRLYFVSAFYKPVLNRLFAIPDDKQALLPNFVAEKRLAPRGDYRPHHLVCALDLTDYPNKGLDRLIPAFATIRREFPGARLDIIGRGPDRIRKEIASLIEQAGVADATELLGELPNADFLARLPHYGLLAMPSHQEAFGMVYVEALLCGVPILHSKGTGIDGFIDWIPSRAAVSPSSTDEIVQGLRHLLANMDRHRAWLRDHHGEVLEAFQRAPHLEAYSQFIRGLDDSRTASQGPPKAPAGATSPLVNSSDKDIAEQGSKY